MDNQIYALIEQMEEVLDRATKVPLMSKIMIDEDSLLEILDRMRAALPEEIKDANFIIAEKERITEDARSEARRIIERAQVQAEQVMMENEITLQAKAYSEELVMKAQQYSREVKMGTLKYSDDLLNDLEKRFEEAFKSIKSSREELVRMARWDDRVQATTTES